MSGAKWKEYLDSIVIWANQRGYEVCFERGGDSCICYISKVIEINSSCDIDKQVYYLLHECGHVLIFNNGSVHDFDLKRVSSKHTTTSKVYVVIEEIEAWKRGYELSKRLLIPIDKDEWEKAMVRALKKYINWASY